MVTFQNGGHFMIHKIDINSQTQLGTLVTFFPAITSRLNDLHIDYCCKGDRSIGSALEETGLPQDFILEVQTAYDDFLSRPDKELPVSEKKKRNSFRRCEHPLRRRMI